MEDNNSEEERENESNSNSDSSNEEEEVSHEAPPELELILSGAESSELELSEFDENLPFVPILRESIARRRHQELAEFRRSRTLLPPNSWRLSARAGSQQQRPVLPQLNNPPTLRSMPPLSQSADVPQINGRETWSNFVQV